MQLKSINLLLNKSKISTQMIKNQDQNHLFKAIKIAKKRFLKQLKKIKMKFRMKIYKH